jgi:transposase
MTRATKARWEAQVRRWRASGQTAREFALRHGLNANTLRWWASRLGRDAAARPGFVEVTLAAPVVEGRVEIVVRDGLSIRVSGAFDETVLRRVLAIVEAR